MLTEMWVDRTDYHHTRVVQGDMPTPGEGEILVAIDKFAMTANNVTYAASGDMFGYWQFYPTTEDPWGRSRCGVSVRCSRAMPRALPSASGSSGFFPWRAM